MMFDAHVHMGYYTRQGFDEPWYYSPRRVAGVLNRCSVDEFIVSSTCVQVGSISIWDLNREAREMKRIAGGRAHLFLWVTGRLLENDPQLTVLDEGLYEGVKLHEMETPWVRDRRSDLERVLKIAEERSLPVQFHSATIGTCSTNALARFANKFQDVRFDFAHCLDMIEMTRVMADLPNVWTDTAYLPFGLFQYLSDYEWHERLMFGTDLPVWQAQEKCGLTERYRQYVTAWERTGINGKKAFRSFLG